ncbi:MAG: transglutaminase-like domain-containing protein [Planctomycetota bacterium]|nr:transglutaminase-like domain-containing protein [Planctomycetota bacterium]
MRTRTGHASSAHGAGWRLRFAVGAALAVTGGAAAFALCHSIDPDRGPLDAGRRVAATILALSTGLVGLFELHRLRIEDAARGRVAPGSTGGPAAWRLAVGIAAGLFTIALVLATGAELAVLAARSSAGDAEVTSGPRALEEARARAAALAETMEEPPGPERLVSPDPSGRSRRGAAGATTGASPELGNLLSDVPVLEVLDPGNTWSDADRPVHLRGFVIEAFDEDGVPRERAGSPRVERADVDGWIQRGTARDGDDLPRRVIELEVRSRGPALELVFAPHRLVAVELSTIARDALSEALYLDALEERRSVRVRSEIAHELSVAEARTLVARGSLPAGHIALALPEDPRGTRAFRAASARLDALAGDLVASADSDFERVLAVVEHLRSSFAYELYSVDFLGTEGCGALLERRGGSCTHFASLAVLLLRRAGIPARIAAGYVARERVQASDGGGRWLVRQRDGHAWIEVHFEGAGWLPFDPTPGDATVGGALRGWSPLAPSEEDRRDGPGRTSSLAALVIDGTRAIVGSGSGWIAGVLAALLIAAASFARMLRSPPRTAAGDPTERPSRPVADPPALDEGVAAVMRALRGRGWRPRVGEPPRRHAARIEAENPEAAGLEAFVVAALERACDPAARPAGPGEIERGVELARRLSEPAAAGAAAIPSTEMWTAGPGSSRQP